MTLRHQDPASSRPCVIKTLRHQDPASSRPCVFNTQGPNVPPELYNLTDFPMGDLECAREVVQGIMKAKLNIKGQKYLTSSMFIPIIKPVSPET